MARKAGALLKIVIFVLTWIVGTWFFSDFGGTGGSYTGFLFIGQSVLGSDLAGQGGSLVGMIFSFIITAAAYYIVAEILTYLLLLLFGRNEPDAKK